MYRHGHLGITLLILAPISYALVQNGQFVIAGLLVFGVFIIEPLLDITIEYPDSHTVV
ncbi:hypothetical protein [Haladaptatus caseinilyticus]|uniref:hypothetical protein n=1 Tax=Haladaptatus caseinilyticus TaxID=2993314 RepID=UPI00224AEAB1|nr:hypothetical protein [Haladaptatus caseinilyticus]